MSALSRLIFATALLLCTQIAGAATGSSQGTYFAARGGPGLLQDGDVTIHVPGLPPFGASLNYDPGFLASTALGYSWSNGLAVEGELAFHGNGLKDENVMGTVIELDGQETSFAALVNARYGFDTRTRVTPYLGAGLGAALLTVSGKPTGGTRFKDSDMVFAYQAMAGVSYALSPRLDLGIEYRYFATAKSTFADNSQKIDVNYNAHNVLLTLSYDLQ